MSLKIEQLEDLLRGNFNCTILNQTVTRLTAPGENFGSLMLKVDIKVKENDEEKIINAVAKCVPVNKFMQKVFNTPVTFKNEIAWYTTIIPTMIRFQKENNVKQTVDFFPTLYGARFSLDPNSNEVDENAVILTENLAVRGFKNIDRKTGFDLETSKEVIRKLAAFHAIPMALKLKKPELFDTNIKKHLYGSSDRSDPFNKTLFPIFKEILEKSTFLKVEEVFDKYIFNKPTSTEPREPWATTLHNDFWGNNIMIKEEMNKPPKVIILDLQTCIYGSAVSDLLFFIGTSVQMSVLENNIDELIKLYYIELMENLKFLNADTTLFPYSSYMEELKLEGPQEFVHLLFFVLIAYAEKETVEDTNASGFQPGDHIRRLYTNIGEKHKKKFRLVAEEFAKRNWI